MRGLNIAISGKGGVGKSTIAATWSYLLAKRGFPVNANNANPDVNLVLHENEFVILDMEAGVEHLGHTTLMGVDALVVVTEPGSRSFETARHIMNLAADIGLDKKYFLLLNKVRENDRTAIMAENMLPGIPVLGTIPFDERYIAADEERKSVFELPHSDNLLAGFKQTLDALITQTTLRR